MTLHRYAVIDSDGFKINTIVADDQIIDGYYPGYGAKLIDEGLEPEEPKPEPAPPKPDDFGLLDVKLDAPMLTGDRINFKSGIVTKREDIAKVEAVDVIAAVDAEAIK